MARQQASGRLQQLLRLAAEEFSAAQSPLPIPTLPQNASSTAAHACDAIVRGGARQHTAATNSSLQTCLQDARGGHGGLQLAHAAGWRSVHVPALVPQARRGPDRSRQFQTSAAALAQGKPGAVSNGSSSSDAAAADAATGQTERIKQRGRLASSSEATAAVPADVERAAPDAQACSPPPLAASFLPVQAEPATSHGYMLSPCT